MTNQAQAEAEDQTTETFVTENPKPKPQNPHAKPEALNNGSSAGTPESCVREHLAKL